MVTNRNAIRIVAIFMVFIVFHFLFFSRYAPLEGPDLFRRIHTPSSVPGFPYQRLGSMQKPFGIPIRIFVKIILNFVFYILCPYIQTASWDLWTENLKIFF